MPLTLSIVRAVEPFALPCVVYYVAPLATDGSSLDCARAEGRARNAPALRFVGLAVAGESLRGAGFTAFTAYNSARYFVVCGIRGDRVSRRRVLTCDGKPASYCAAVLTS